MKTAWETRRFFIMVKISKIAMQLSNVYLPIKFNMLRQNCIINEQISKKGHQLVSFDFFIRKTCFESIQIDGTLNE